MLLQVNICVYPCYSTHLSLVIHPICKHISMPICASVLLWSTQSKVGPVCISIWLCRVPISFPFCNRDAINGTRACGLHMPCLVGQDLQAHLLLCMLLNQTEAYSVALKQNLVQQQRKAHQRSRKHAWHHAQPEELSTRLRRLFILSSCLLSS